MYVIQYEKKQIVKYCNESEFCSIKYTADGSTTRSLVECAVCSSVVRQISISENCRINENVGSVLEVYL